jgi:putative hydrolase of the HAD superfamily
MTNTARASADLSHIETWIFDLDNTLYSPATRLFDQIDHRMTAFIAEQLRLDPADARKLQKDYFRSHGTTLSGLIDVHGIEPKRFLDFVHQIDVSGLARDEALGAALARLPGRRIVYTNGSAEHARRVLTQLGIADAFEAVHDIVAGDYCPKPHREAYEALITRHAITPVRAAMFEDTQRNLEVPHAMGMTTVHVTAEQISLPHIHHSAGDLAGFLASARVMPYEQAPQTEKNGR